MKKKLLLIPFLLMLAACDLNFINSNDSLHDSGHSNTVESGSANSDESNATDSFTSDKSSVSEKSDTPTNSVTSATSTPSESSPGITIDSGAPSEPEIDYFAGLYGNGLLVAKRLALYSNDGTSFSYTTINYDVVGGIVTEKTFKYDYIDRYFETSMLVIDSSERSTRSFAGFVSFYWGTFNQGVFGGEYSYGSYYINGIRFTEMSYSGLKLNWQHANYAETNYPANENNHNANMIARIDLSFNCLQESVYYADDFLKTISPSLTLF